MMKDEINGGGKVLQLHAYISAPILARAFLGGVVLRTRFCVAPASSSPSTATEILLRIPCVSFLCGRSDASPDFFDSSDHFDASISTLAPCLIGRQECRFPILQTPT